MENHKTQYSKEEIDAKVRSLLAMDLSKLKVIEEKEELQASKLYDVSLPPNPRAKPGCASSDGKLS